MVSVKGTFGKISTYLEKAGMGVAVGVGVTSITNQFLPRMFSTFAGGLASYKAGGIIGALAYIFATGGLSQFTGFLGGLGNGSTGGSA